MYYEREYEMSNTKNQPAFPGTSEFPNWQQNTGLTKREYAAIEIMAGLTASERGCAVDAQSRAGLAVFAADALLKALKEGK
jgi:hypothetical protein